MTGEWIQRLAEDERKRDDVRSRATDAAARKAALVHEHGQNLLDQLKTAMVRDIEAFRNEFPGDGAREVVFEDVQADGGFAVHKPQYPSAALNIAPHLQSASVSCRYRFTPTNGLPPREDRLELMFTGNGDGVLHIKHQGTGQVFTNADALSEYLLVPVFTGRPR
jgi:hypothetical protein